jgi:Tfp pilus assembly protein PilO
MKYSIIIITTGILISIIMGTFLFWPKYQEFNSLNDALIIKKVQLENQNRYTQQLLTMERKIQENQELADKVNSILPLGPGIPSLLNFLQETSIETGMSLDNVTWQKLLPSRNEEKKRLKEYSLNLKLSGSYFAFMNFISSLEKSSRLINIVATEFSVPIEENEPIPFSLVLKIYSY